MQGILKQLKLRRQDEKNYKFLYKFVGWNLEPQDQPEVSLSDIEKALDIDFLKENYENEDSFMKFEETMNLTTEER